MFRPVYIGEICDRDLTRLRKKYQKAELISCETNSAFYIIFIDYAQTKMR